ncbi:DUF3788 domain-containing protein [Acetivibrio cellulolyticus]|uniref:DUF3788 domain-containing protein n=1 Tax=Acetivibrio cellulolyticus TaxID=35830 RepID=UPI0001E2C7DF|nr:DUF3788 domain-containing protein [Acetivibrio cellulolyticus]
MEPQRMLDKTRKPHYENILDYIGENAKVLWVRINEFIEENYDYIPELKFAGINYGWEYKYRRSNKSLCALYPERNAFTILIVLGKKEVEMFQDDISRFGAKTVEIFNETKQFHDGKWLWIRVGDENDVEDIIKLLKIKKKPMKK